MIDIIQKDVGDKQSAGMKRRMNLPYCRLIILVLCHQISAEILIALLSSIMWKTIWTRKALRECKPPTGRHLELKSRDHSMRYMLFLICGSWKPSLHLFSPTVFRIFACEYVCDTTLTFSVTWRHRHVTIWCRRCHFSIVSVQLL